uniref:Uncharacterized protein n=1 Tax=Taeniopygia guttata TaxID=59729 RepID=A0A674GMW8_TAEGU
KPCFNPLSQIKVNTTQARHAQHSSHPLQSGIFPRENSAMDELPRRAGSRAGPWWDKGEASSSQGLNSWRLPSWKTKHPGQSPPRCESISGALIQV